MCIFIMNTEYRLAYTQDSNQNILIYSLFQGLFSWDLQYEDHNIP